MEFWNLVENQKWGNYSIFFFNFWTLHYHKQIGYLYTYSSVFIQKSLIVLSLIWLIIKIFKFNVNTQINNYVIMISKYLTGTVLISNKYKEGHNSIVDVSYAMYRHYYDTIG